jgi:hypothetical protein
MSLKTNKLIAFAATAALTIVGVGAISAPANAAACPYPVENQAANDKPKYNIRLISPSLTDDNSIRRYDFESQFTMDCDWFGVGMRFNQVYVPFGLKTNLTFQVTSPTKTPVANTKVTLRANKGYSNSNGNVKVNGIKARPAPSNASDGANIVGTTDVNGVVNFVVQSPDDCEAYGGILPDAPANITQDTPNDRNADPTTDCYSQFLPSITGEKTDSADFLELHYFNPNLLTGGGIDRIDGNGTEATIRTKDEHSLSVGDKVIVSGILPSGFNGTFTVTAVPTAKSFTYANTTIGSLDLLELHYFNSKLSTGGRIDRVDGNGTNATIRTLEAHGLEIGDQVVISGILPVGFNGTFKVTAVPNPKSFTYANATVGLLELSFASTREVAVYPATDANISLLAPTLRVAETETGKANAMELDGRMLTYAPIASKQVIAFQAIKGDGSYARNQPVTVRINLANSGSNAKTSAGIFGLTGTATALPANTTKTAEDQLVLTGTTDSFGTVVFSLNNTDTVAGAKPATATTAPAAGSKFARIFAGITGKVNTGTEIEFHYYKPVPPTSIAVVNKARKITVTLNYAKGKRSVVTITGLKPVAVTPTADKKDYSYTVKKGKITVKVVSNGKTLTKVFNVK